MTGSLPPVPKLKTIAKLLPVIFPEGLMIPRAYLIREMTAKSIFVMFYAGAIENSDRWVRPDQITTKMTEQQTRRLSTAYRLAWIKDSMTPGKMKNISGQWYEANTRESVRDESLRYGLVAVGAVIRKPGVPVTSSKPRYALEKQFAGLFYEQDKDSLLQKIQAWQSSHLSPEAMARVTLVRRGISAAASKEHVLATLPNRETRLLSPGQSSILTKDVLEQFCQRFLKEPGLILLSESGNKIIARDDELAQSIGLVIQASSNLPDLILLDLGSSPPLLVFVEVVITDGAITSTRKNALANLAETSGFRSSNIAYLTAFIDRDHAYRRFCSALAWDSFVWFASEPDSIIVLKGMGTMKTRNLIDLV